MAMSLTDQQCHLSGVDVRACSCFPSEKSTCHNTGTCMASRECVLADGSQGEPFA